MFIARILRTPQDTVGMRGFRSVRKIAKRDIHFYFVCLSVRPSIRPHETNRPSLNVFF